MRWIDKYSTEKKHGMTRNRTAFLFFPKSIRQNGLTITRWLEMATWTEEWNFRYPETVLGPCPPAYALREGTWTSLYWVDDEETALQALGELPLPGRKK